MIDEELYRRAAEELDSGNRRAHLWARACSLASDDHDEARFLYTNLRVEELQAELEEADFQQEQASDNSLPHIASVDNLELEPVEFETDAPSDSGIESTRAGESSEIEELAALSDDGELDGFGEYRPEEGIDDHTPDDTMDDRVAQMADALDQDPVALDDPRDPVDDFDLDDVMGTGAIDDAVLEAGIRAEDIEAEVGSIELALDTHEHDPLATADPMVGLDTSDLDRAGVPRAELDTEIDEEALSFDTGPQLEFNEALAEELDGDARTPATDIQQATSESEPLLDFPAADDLFAEDEHRAPQAAPDAVAIDPLPETGQPADEARPAASDDAASQDSVDELLRELAAESERRSPKDEIDAGAGIPVSHSASYTADLDWIDDVVRSDDANSERSDEPTDAKRIEPKIPAPAVGGMITGTLDAGGYRTYSLFARADGHWQAVNQGVSWSALGLTFPWLIYRQLYLNAFLYALFWIVCLTGLVVTSLAWFDNPGQGVTLVPLMTVGFALLAFLGLIYVPFRHANKWRMARLAERGFEKVGEVQSLSSNRALKVMQNQLAMVRQRH